MTRTADRIQELRRTKDWPALGRALVRAAILAPGARVRIKRQRKKVWFTIQQHVFLARARCLSCDVLAHLGPRQFKSWREGVAYRCLNCGDRSVVTPKVPPWPTGAFLVPDPKGVDERPTGTLVREGALCLILPWCLWERVIQLRLVGDENPATWIVERALTIESVAQQEAKGGVREHRRQLAIAKRQVTHWTKRVEHWRETVAELQSPWPSVKRPAAEASLEEAEEKLQEWQDKLQELGGER